MKTASAKAKGRRLQQFVRDRILEVFNWIGFRPDDVKSTSMGAPDEDIQLSPFARDILPVSIECKSHKSMAVYKLYDQAMDNCNGYHPVLVIKADRREPLAVIDFEHWLQLELTRVKEETYDE